MTELVLALGAGLAAGQALGGVLGERVGALALLAPHGVQEQVGRDPVQPALERARAVGVQRPEHAYEDLLGDVLGVVRVARQPVGEAVDPAGVVADDLLPRRLDPDVAVGVRQDGLDRGRRRPCRRRGRRDRSALRRAATTGVHHATS